jgi:hypothetical protein
MKATKEKLEQFETQIQLLQYQVKLNDFHADKLIEIVIDLQRMIASVEYVQNQITKQGSEFIGSKEWASAENVAKSYKMNLIKKITEI